MNDNDAVLDVTDDQDLDTSADVGGAPETIEEQIEALEPLSQWPADLREDFATWATIQGENLNGRRIQERFLDMAKQNDSRVGELGSRLDQLNRKYQPFESVLQEFGDDLAMSGMAPEVAIRQALTLARRLVDDPKWGVQHLAKTYNLNLSELAEGQPYVDPVVAGQIDPLRQEIQRLRGQLDQRNQSEQQAFAEKARDAAEEFENAVDENGKPKYPYLQELREDVVKRAMTDIKAGRIPNYAEHYEQACYASKEVREKLILEQTKRVTSQKTAEAQKAKQASARVKGTGSSKGNEKLPSRRASVKSAADKMDWPT